MSVWAEVEGRTVMHKSVHFSFHKFFNELIEDDIIDDGTRVYVLSESKDDTYIQHFRFVMDQEGDGAVYVIRKMMKRMPKDVTLEMKTSIQWYS